MTTSSTANNNQKERIIGGQYKIVKELGAGGMGSIFYGVHMLTEQPVAIKMLHPSLVNDEVVRKRFLSEASVLARMEHPNIVQWKNSIEDETGLYLIMQYVEGDNVENRLEKHGQVPLEDAIIFAIQTLAGLECVHSKGVVHRDLKPSNILLTQDDQVKLADFGIARLTGTNRFTKAGMTIGTFFYMSPEQIMGHDSDHRADVYSMGITLYEMLTGQIPFQGETEFDVCKQHLESPLPSIRKKASHLPKKLDAILSKATAKKPDDRFQSAAEFAAALQINFPELAKKATSGSGSSLSKSDVTKLLNEYNKKQSKGGCSRMLFWLFVIAALIVGLGYVYFYIIDSPETVPIKHGEVKVRNDVPVRPRPTNNTTKPPTRKLTLTDVTATQPYKAKFATNPGLWPMGTHFGATLALAANAYRIKTGDGTGQVTTCPAKIKAVSAPFQVAMTTHAITPAKDGRAVHGVALLFEQTKGKSRGIYVAIDPAKQKVRVARLTDGKWTNLLAWTSHTSLKTQGPNELTAKVEGDTLQITINQVALPPVSDATYKQGRTCLFTQRGGTTIDVNAFNIKK